MSTQDGATKGGGDSMRNFLNFQTFCRHPNFMPHETNLFTEETGYNFRKYGKLADQKLLCERMGSVCTAVVQEDENSWSLRENVQLISFESISEVFPSIKQLMIGSPSTYLKVFC